MQTAELLAAELGIGDVRPDDSLAECVPGTPPVPGKSPPTADRKDPLRCS